MSIKGLFKEFNSYLINVFFVRIPSHRIRKAIIVSQFGSFGVNTNFLLGCEFRTLKNIYIGSNTVINQKVLLDGRGGKLIIGNNVDIAQETNIWTLEHDPHSDFHKARGADVIIGDYVWIASRVTILPGVTIGKGAVIATGAVVTRDVPEMTIFGGVPAKKIGTRTSQLKYTLKYKPKFR